MFGRMPGEPYYNTAIHPDESPSHLQNPAAQFVHDQFDSFNPKPPKEPKPGFGPPGYRSGPFYMAGLGRSVAEANLAQMLGQGANSYIYANNNPVNYIDLTGDEPVSMFKLPPFCIPIPCLGNVLTACNRHCFGLSTETSACFPLICQDYIGYKCYDLPVCICTCLDLMVCNPTTPKPIA